MSLALIPIAALLFLISSLSPDSHGPSSAPVKSAVIKQKDKQDEAEEKKQEIKRRLFQESEKSEIAMIEAANRDPLAPHDISDERNLDDNSEYETIMSYISTKYKKVSDEDAQEIAKSLVVYGKEHNMDPKLAAAVIARESSFNKKAVSSTGAKGLGQIKDFNFSTLNINNPYDIKQNIGGTTQYLKKMLSKWDERMSPKQSTKNSQTVSVALPETEKKDPRIVPQSESEKIKLALASYYKGFTNVNKTGVDEKTEEYVRDIIKNYNDLQTIQNEKRLKRQD